MSRERERAYERRRYEEWQRRRSAAQARRRRLQQGIALGGVGVLVLAALVATVLVLNREDATTADPGTVPTDPAASAPADPGATSSAAVPDPALAENRTWTGSIALTQGTVDVELYGAEAPQAVANFVTLAQQGFFDGTRCHRLVTSGIHVLQCGDPTATGSGGPGYSWGPIENAPADDVYPAGTIAMARVGGDAASMGSQFFLVYEDSQIPSDAAGGYTVFGRITSGLDVVQAIADAGTTEGTESPVSDVIIQKVETQ
ncbi:peptidylprolyl isomerase [Cellulomonas marina]|uniref:Peptidyl-prolyl cis-trans isomerase n=1 Tax=Cellulomonas marina TaxID=988821 RepID=A0A1I0W669_9CELL|nr:peptidylprolyl isomerase [Cellulomonas marina]GIG29152.1 peptidyl-prolyl cis-trans isomerase [Cellulomonas marina]SFA84249.1 peptidyl-prolyl cis-trans isomerase B (cyclophilin B) [Cellulomonas marina]